MIKGHGDDLYRYEGIKANFSSNVYAATDNQALMQYLASVLVERSASYPEPEPYTLQARLAEYHGLRPENILVTNGATEAIYLIAHSLAGRQVSIAEPTFSEYRSATELYQSPIVSGASIRWMCNPNNPTGQARAEELAEGEELLIVDRSYEYFCRKALPSLLLDGRHIYIYSLTKRYRMPGLRLGYIVASDELIALIAAMRQPWSVNALAIEAGLWLVQNRFPESIDRQRMWAESDALYHRLSSLPGIEIEPTDTHFMLLRTPIEASVLKERLALDYAILVRDASNFEGLSPYHIRIASQGQAADERLVIALSDIMAQA